MEPFGDCSGVSGGGVGGVKHLNADLKRLAKNGQLVAPRQLSKVRAQALVKRGWATVYPFHQRWNLRLTITAEGKAAAEALA